MRKLLQQASANNGSGEKQTGGVRTHTKREMGYKGKGNMLRWGHYSFSLGTDVQVFA